MGKDGKFSELSVNYSLHIDHILLARKKFEEEMRYFNDELYEILSQSLREHLDHNACIKYSDLEVEGSSRTSSSTSFWISSSAKIMVKRADYKVFRSCGSFVTGVYFDSELKKFCWHVTFSNLNLLSDQIDERCFDLAKSKGGEVFQNPTFERSSQVIFFRVPIDSGFPLNVKERLNSALELTLEEIKTALGEANAQIESEGQVLSAA